jgi:peptide/nickel transport system substrate-binding protein
MKKEDLVLLVVTFCLLIPVFTPTTKAAGQPPIATNTFWEGNVGWGPSDADPGIAYDTASGELLFNSYQTLIAWNGEKYYDFIPILATNVPTLQSVTMTVTNTTAVNGANPVGSKWTDGTTAYTLVGWQDEEMDGFNQGDVIYLTDGTAWRTWTVDGYSGTSTISLNLWRGFYVFNLRTSPTVYFYDHNGNHVGTFKTTDAVYTLQRYMVTSDIKGYSPVWMYDKALFDVPDHTVFTNSTAMDLAHLINDAFVGDSVAHTLTINIGDHFPDNAFKQILSNTWGSMMSKNNTIAMGDWDGNLFTTTKYGGPFPDWWLDWANQGVGRLADYESGGVPANTLAPDGSTYIGTGPYHISTVDAVNYRVIMQKNLDFWMGWPANYAGFVSNGSLDVVEIDYIANWNTRREAFLSGAIDSCAVPRAYMFQLLDNATKQPLVPGMKTVSHIAPTLSCDMNMFQFVISNTSTHIGTGSMPGGVPLDFFNNTHTRRAFAYSFDWSTYSVQAYYRESTYRKNFLALGLYPDYYNGSVPGFTASLANAEAELKLAIFSGTSVWDSGFTLELCYDTGNDAGRIACTLISTFMMQLSTYDGRAGKPPFNVIVTGEARGTYLADIRGRRLPMYDEVWLADFADADDFVRPYMYSTGPYAGLQGYTAANGYGTLKDTLIDQAVLTPDGSARQALYQRLQLIYYNDCPSFPLGDPMGRIYMYYWVKGWYYDAMYPSTFYYTIWKQDNPWYDISGPTTGMSDGVVNMKDLAYLIAHFNAKAPLWPGVPPPIDPKWVGVYGANGCVDPYSDRTCNVRDIAGIIFNFNAKGGTGHP